MVNKVIESINVAVDVLSLLAMGLCSGLCLAVILGQRSYRIVHILAGFQTHRFLSLRDTSFHSWKQELMRKKWLMLLSNSALLFCMFRVLHEAVSLAQHALRFVDMEASEVVKQARRICDYSSLFAYFVIFCMVIPVWLQCALVWLDSSAQRKKLVITVLVYVFLAVAIAVAGVALIPQVVFAIIELSTLGRVDVESPRKIVLFAVSAPFGFLMVVLVLGFVVVFGVGIMQLIRKSSFARSKQSMNSALQKQVQQQKVTMYKISIAMAFFSVCVVVRIAGVAAYAVKSMPDFVVYGGTRTLPDVLFIIALCLVFWPWPLPLVSVNVGAPIRLIHGFVGDLKDKATHMTAVGEKQSTVAHAVGQETTELHHDSHHEAAHTS